MHEKYPKSHTPKTHSFRENEKEKSMTSHTKHQKNIFIEPQESAKRKRNKVFKIEKLYPKGL